MPRRIEIELTSARPDGTWTWRAAGARQPKGVLDGGLLYEGAKAGDVLRAEADFELEGIVITSVTAPKADQRPEPPRIEIVGPGRPEGPGVTTQLVGRGERRDRRRDGDDRRRDSRDRGPARPRGDGPRREGAPVGAGTERGGRPPRSDGPRRDQPGRDAGRRDGREGAGPRPPRGDGDRRPSSPARTSSQADRTDRSRARRLSPGSAHRKAVMESLSPEHQPIADHLLRGGIPAVRTALHLEREKAEAEGRPAPNSEALLALAESLLPRLRAAEWRDRAEAAVAALDTLSMRDLRSVVAGADQARDDDSRKLAATLREAVEARVAKLHSDWVADITTQLDAGRGVRAVRLSARPPDATAKLDPELTARLTEVAGATLAPATSPDLWMSMLEALAESPIRRAVTPVGLPEDPPPDLKRAAHQYSGSIPALAKMLGVTIPPPPAPAGARKRPDRPGGGRPPRPDRAARSAPAGPAAVPPEAEAAVATTPAAAPESSAPETAAPETAAPESSAPEAGPTPPAPAGPSTAEGTPTAETSSPAAETSSPTHTSSPAGTSAEVAPAETSPAASPRAETSPSGAGDSHPAGGAGTDS